MCDTDKKLIWTLIKNNIPMVLNFDRHEDKIFMYFSKHVYYNVLKPIFEKKQYLTNIICYNSRRYKVDHCHDHFKVICHTCTANNTFIYIAVLQDPNCPSLKLFTTPNKFKSYYGIKNMTIKTYNEQKTKQIIKVYLL